MSLACATPPLDVLVALPAGAVVAPADVAEPVVELVDFLLDDPHALSTNTAVRTIPTTW
jgi:hypothetical protein